MVIATVDVLRPASRCHREMSTAENVASSGSHRRKSLDRLTSINHSSRRGRLVRRSFGAKAPWNSATDESGDVAFDPSRNQDPRPLLDSHVLTVHGSHVTYGACEAPRQPASCCAGGPNPK